MSDLIIKGMEMPDSCFHCKLAEVCQYYKAEHYANKRHEDCPLEEAPETHDKRTETQACDLIERQAAIDAIRHIREVYVNNLPTLIDKASVQTELMMLPSVQRKTQNRRFEEIVVTYPNPDLCSYPEYKGKPYFSIKYEENEEHYIGYGTYNPEVLSQYIKEYFILPSAQPTIEPERKKGKWLLSDGYRCSVCNYKVLSTGLPSKCPNCYAEMER